MRRAIASSLRLLAIASVLPTGFLLAQNGSMRVTVPSPTAATLGRFGDVPVSLNTGVPDISIPLFTAKGRTIEVPIVLKYHSAGVRVEEIGGWAGIGWTLEAGGAITRSVRGIADDAPGGYYNTGTVFYQGGNWPNPPTNVLTELLNGTIDGDPDQFFFSFGGRSGQFVMGPTGMATREYRSIPYQKLDIAPTGGFAGWVIIAEDGTKYRFEAPEATTDLSFPSQGGIIPGQFGEIHTSSWQLTRIVAPGGDSVKFNYTPYTVTHRPGLTREKFDFVVASPTNPSCVPGQFDHTLEHQIQVQRLSSIETAAHTITFSVDPTLRSDATSPQGALQEPRLDLITVSTPSGTVLRTFKLDHDYSTTRLTLKQVTERDASGVPLPPHTFTYDPLPLPPRTSFAADHWGFYNGKGNTTSVPAAISTTGIALSGADRSPDPAFARAGILTKVTYPTGGSSEFIYEGNSYGAVGPGAAAPVVPGPIEVSSLTSSDFQGLLSQTFTVSGTEPIIGAVGVALSPPGCGNQVGCPYVEIVGKGLWTADGNFPVALTPGTYTMRAYSDGTNNFASIYLSWQPAAASTAAPGGGLRVKEIRTNDGTGTITYRKYSYTLQADPARSSGIVSQLPDYDYQFNDAFCQYFSRSSTSRMPLGDGPPVAYREVIVSSGANGEFGRTLHKFRSVVDAADLPPPFNVWPFSTRTSFEWKRGQEVENTEYNAASQTQQQTVTSHTFRDEGTPDPITTRRFRGVSLNVFAGGCQGCTSFVYNPFEVISAWSYPNAETVTTFDESGGSSFSTSRSYVYGNPNHTQLTEMTETNSTGTQRITRTKYPADYAAGSNNLEAVALTAMQGSSHQHSQVIERWTVEKVGAAEKVVKAEITTFKAFGASPIWYLPFQRFVLSSPTSIP